MKNATLLNSKLIDIFICLSVDENLNFVDGNEINVTINNKPLLQLNIERLHLPLPIDKLLEKTSPLENDFVEMDQLANLFNTISKNQAFIGLNHVGICYKVESQADERERIKKEIINTGWHLYEMESNDEGLWLFVGDKSNWRDPLIELLPVENTDDEWVNYWLPHIQVDIDTKLSDQQLKELITRSFGGKVIPFNSCVIDGIVYGVRARLGIISGVNIALDFATKERRIQYSREHLLKVII
jgi:hypothetical protein